MGSELRANFPKKGKAGLMAFIAKKNHSEPFLYYQLRDPSPAVSAIYYNRKINILNDIYLHTEMWVVKIIANKALRI